MDTFALCGGAEINAAFMRADMVDEISLVIGPGVDGSRNALTYVGSEDMAGFPKFYRLKEVRQINGNISAPATRRMCRVIFPRLLRGA